MENIQKRSKHSLRTVDIAYIALSAALITVCAWIAIPFTISFTLQTFAICFTAGLLGFKRGVTAVIVYILLGAAGLPVFTGFKGGIGAIAGTTGGYIIGFIFTAAIAGFTADHFHNRTGLLAASMAAGVAVCYAFGTAWFMHLYIHSTGAIGLGAVLMKCVAPFIIPDLIKIAVAALLVKRISPFVK